MAHSAMTVSRDEFAGLVTQFLRAHGEARGITHDAARNRLLVGARGEDTSFVFLGHAFKEYGEAPPGELQRVLARRFWSSVRRTTEPTRDEVWSRVLPRVRDLAWFSAVRRQMELDLGGDEKAIEQMMLPYKPLNAELAVHLVIELPTSVMELGPEALKSSGLKFDELFARAVEKLKGRSTLTWESPQPGVFVSPYHDALDATRMLLTEQVAALKVQGKPVAISPTHDLLFITGDEDEAGLVAVAGWGEEALLEPRPHCAVAFRLEDGSWKPWLPPHTSPAWPKLKLLQLQTLASAYARQKEVLDALLSANGHALVVVGMCAFKVPTGEIFTACVWQSGVEALIPQTDRIDFVKVPPSGDVDSAEVWSTSFEVARQTVGALMEPSGDVPPRWRVKGFPEQATLEAMAEKAPLPE
jgi:hypothetical protein